MFLYFVLTLPLALLDNMLIIKGEMCPPPLYLRSIIIPFYDIALNNLYKKPYIPLHPYPAHAHNPNHPYSIAALDPYNPQQTADNKAPSLAIGLT